MADASGTAVVRSGALLPAVVAPNALDRFFLAIAPQYGVRRYEARCRMEAASWFFGGGGYNAAKNDRQVTKNWSPRLDSPDSATIPDIRDLRRRAADAERNDPIGAGAV